MPRFFSGEIFNDTAFLSVEDSKHVSRVLRMKEGDSLILSDGFGYDYNCSIKSIGERVELLIDLKYENVTEPTNKVKLTLYQCLPKGDKLEFIVQKAVELGAYKIVPVLSKYCVCKSDKLSFEKKRERLQKISLEAAKQSGRGIIPEISSLLSFENAVEIASKAKKAIIFYEGGGKQICELLKGEKPDEISIIIGSEGGFCQEEIEFATDHNVCVSTLGSLILRCETAPIVGIALTLHEFSLM